MLMDVLQVSNDGFLGLGLTNNPTPLIQRSLGQPYRVLGKMQKWYLLTTTTHPCYLQIRKGLLPTGAHNTSQMSGRRGNTDPASWGWIHPGQVYLTKSLFS